MAGKGWNKESDWLPLSNALAQVKFWKEDLRQAEEFLSYIEPFANLLGFEKMYEEGIEDVHESEDGLRNARAKLRSTMKRVK